MRIRSSFWRLAIWKDTRGQDLIEYALLCSFLVFATVAVVPDVLSKASQIMVGVHSNICAAGGSCPAPATDTEHHDDGH